MLSMAPEVRCGDRAQGPRDGRGIGACRSPTRGSLGADLGLTAEVLAAALQRIGFDLVIAGNQSTDGSGGVIPAMIAELLDVPSATALNSVEIDGADGVAASARPTAARCRCRRRCRR